LLQLRPFRRRQRQKCQGVAAVGGDTKPHFVIWREDLVKSTQSNVTILRPVYQGCADALAAVADKKVGTRGCGSADLLGSETACSKHCFTIPDNVGLAFTPVDPKNRGVIVEQSTNGFFACRLQHGSDDLDIQNVNKQWRASAGAGLDHTIRNLNITLGSDRTGKNSVIAKKPE